MFLLAGVEFSTHRNQNLFRIDKRSRLDIIQQGFLKIARG
jgi:hypothetical protein